MKHRVSPMNLREFFINISSTTNDQLYSIPICVVWSGFSQFDRILINAVISKLVGNWWRRDESDDVCGLLIRKTEIDLLLAGIWSGRVQVVKYKVQMNVRS